MPDRKTNASNLLAQDTQEPARQLSSLKNANGSNRQEMSDEEMKEYLRSQGFEIHKPRKTRGVISNSSPVRGKARVGGYMSKDLRNALRLASLSTNRSESAIIEEAVRMWMDQNNMRT